MNKTGRKSLALVLALMVGTFVAGCGGSGSQGSSEEPKRLTLGIAAGWTENIAVSNLTKVVMENELGYEEVKTQTADLGVVFQGVGNGDLDAFQDMWLPNHAAQLETVEDDVTKLDPWYTGESKFSIVAPSYMNITSIDQLNEAGATEIIGIDPGAVIMPAILDNTIPTYGLKQELVQSSEAAMLSVVEDRYAAREPFAFIGWTPHWMNAEYDITYLEDPENTLVNPGGDPLDEAELSSITRDDLEDEDPAAFAFLDAFQLNEEQTNTLEAEIQEAGANTPTEGAQNWLEQNRDVAQPWIDAAKQAQEQAQK